MKDIYENPLCGRYASREMQHIFSPDFKFSTWRKIWIALAESEQELGLPITDEQINEMKEHIYDIDYEKAADYEHRLRHDVMAHIHTYGDVCPKAMPIIHLGATSCFVGDNTDIIQIREAMQLTRKKLLALMKAIADFAEAQKNQPCLAYTHFQAAQPTTLGKRATLWLQDFAMDLERIDFELGRLKFFGCKGTTGTAASFLKLFEGDEEKVLLVEKKIAEKMGFTECVRVSGQTYTRKIDSFQIETLAGLAQSASKMAVDIRLMAHEKEMEEPFEKEQVGSSAMAYKRNPMRSERVCSLSRYLMTLPNDTAATAANQWMERTLDDSAGRRIVLPEAFLTADAILTLLINVITGAVVYPKVMEKHLNAEMPFMATENILMRAVTLGGDRQELHEAIRVHSQAAAAVVKMEGKDNDLLDRLKADKRFGLTDEILADILDVRKFIGMAPKQVDAYLAELAPVLAQSTEVEAEVRV